MQEVRARGGELFVFADADSRIESGDGPARDPHARALRRAVADPARGDAAVAGVSHGVRAGDGCGQAAESGEERDGGVRRAGSPRPHPPSVFLLSLKKRSGNHISYTIYPDLQDDYAPLADPVFARPALQRARHSVGQAGAGRHARDQLEPPATGVVSAVRQSAPRAHARQAAIRRSPGCSGSPAAGASSATAVVSCCFNSRPAWRGTTSGCPGSSSACRRGCGSPSSSATRRGMRRRSSRCLSGIPRPIA